MNKAEITINGTQIKIETENTVELANILNSIVGETQTGMNKLEKIISTKKGISDGTYKKTAAYLPWSENDVKTVAKVALSYGPSQRGLGEHVLRILKKDGDVKTRGKVNVEIFADRIHRYFYTGNKKGINGKTMGILQKNFSFNGGIRGGGEGDNSVLKKDVKSFFNKSPIEA
jgi:hypothetical protein